MGFYHDMCMMKWFLCYTIMLLYDGTSYGSCLWCSIQLPNY